VPSLLLGKALVFCRRRNILQNSFGQCLRVLRDPRGGNFYVEFLFRSSQDIQQIAFKCLLDSDTTSTYQTGRYYTFLECRKRLRFQDPTPGPRNCLGIWLSPPSTTPYPLIDTIVRSYVSFRIESFDTTKRSSPHLLHSLQALPPNNVDVETPAESNHVQEATENKRVSLRCNTLSDHLISI
jgi:hypothetical protein